MKRKLRNIGIIIGSVVILLGAGRVFSEPGSAGDPLVSLSYLEGKIVELKLYIDKKTTGSSSTEGKDAWVVVEVPEGQSLICKDGTELILRAGEAEAIDSVLGGLTDVTQGQDLKKGNKIPKNHLLIIPRDDGRGAYCKKDSIFLVKGAYEIL